MDFAEIGAGYVLYFDFLKLLILLLAAYVLFHLPIISAASRGGSAAAIDANLCAFAQCPTHNLATWSCKGACPAVINQEVQNSENEAS